MLLSDRQEPRACGVSEVYLLVNHAKAHATCRPAPAVPGKTPRTRADYDADLQRAIQLSLAESSGAGSSSAGLESEPPLRSGQTAQDDDEELRLAIEASLRDMERARPSAPVGMEEPEYRVCPAVFRRPTLPDTLTLSVAIANLRPEPARNRDHPHLLEYAGPDGCVWRERSAAVPASACAI